MKGWGRRWQAYGSWFFLSFLVAWSAWGSEALHLQVARFENRTQAEEAFSELRNGKSFELLAEHWAPEGLKEARGYMGRVVPERLSDPVRRVLLGLRPGESSLPVAVQEAWLVFKVLEPAEASKYSLGEESAVFHLERGILLGELGDAQGELEAYRKAVSLDSGLAAAHVNLGEALRRQAMLILERTPGDLAGGQVGAATQLLDEAIDEFKSALALDEELWEAHYNLGLAYAAQGLLDLTVLEFQEAIAIKPDSGELHRSLALAFLMKERTAEALVHAQRAGQLGAEVGDLLEKINARMGKLPPQQKKGKR